MTQKMTRLRQRLREAHLGSVASLLAALEAKDIYTAHHSVRVAACAKDLSRLLQLSSSETETIRLAALLHDVGKIGIEDRILTKPAKLTVGEFERMKEHSALGATILHPARLDERVVELVLHHHEWFDGTGYPMRLVGQRIPFGARLLHVADSIDAMMTPRCYKRGFSVASAIDELRSHRGSQFDPLIADAAAAWLRGVPRNRASFIRSGPHN